MMRFSGRIEPGRGVGIFGGQSESRSLPASRKARCLSPDPGPNEPRGRAFLRVSALAAVADFFFEPVSVTCTVRALSVAVTMPEVADVPDVRIALSGRSVRTASEALESALETAVVRGNSSAGASVQAVAGGSARTRSIAARRARERVG
jgi:hypothetical protein